MKKVFYLLVGFALLSSCSNAALQEELKTTKSTLAKTESALQTAQQTIAEMQKAETGQLVHVVYFKVKPDANIAAIITEIKKLKAIPAIQDFSVGAFENLGDTRALSDYGLVMEMSFVDKAAYEKYQQHPTHLALKDNLGQFLAGPPATYDFIEQ